MPDMNGTETFNRLRQLHNFNIPVVSLTANALDGMKEKYLKAGFNDYLSKPIDKKELDRVINTYITFTVAVTSDNSGHPLVKMQYGLIGERFEPVYFHRFKKHQPILSARRSVPFSSFILKEIPRCESALRLAPPCPIILLMLRLSV